MLIEDIAQQRRSEILDRWRRMIAESYPAQTAVFLQTQKDRFRNPVGHTIAEQTAELFDALLNGADSKSLSQLVEPLVRIRAVQDFTPAQAVDFVFGLKAAVRHEVALEIQEAAVTKSLLEFESRVDAAALLAFDRYMECREQIYRLRTDELKRQTQHALDRIARMGKRCEMPNGDSLQV